LHNFYKPDVFQLILSLKAMKKMPFEIAALVNTVRTMASESKDRLNAAVAA